MAGPTLVVGVGGMVGSHLAERLLASHAPVVGTWFTPTIDMAELPPSLPIEELDIRDGASLAELFRRHRPQTVFHLAAQSYPALSWERPIETLETNVIGTANLFEAIRAVRAEAPGYDPVVVAACSSAQYGASLLSATGPVTEDAHLLPLHPYGVSKVATDLLTYQYHATYGIRGIRARIFNTSGPRKAGDVISDFARRVAALPPNGGKLRVGNLSTRRAFLHVDDLVEALLLLANGGKAGEAYNISGAEVVSMGDLIPMFEAASQRRIEPEVDSALLRPQDEPVIMGDSGRLRKDTGWTPRRGVADIVGDVYRYERRRAGL